MDSMDGSMDRWMDGWIDGWIDGWMDRWIDRWMDGSMDGWIVGWLDRSLVGWLCDDCVYGEQYHCITCRSHHMALLLVVVGVVVGVELKSSTLIAINTKNRVDIEVLEDQEQELVRKKRDRRPQRDRSNHRDREHELLDGLGSAVMMLDAPSRIRIFSGLRYYSIERERERERISSEILM